MKKINRNDSKLSLSILSSKYCLGNKGTKIMLIWGPMVWFQTSLERNTKENHKYEQERKPS